MDSFRPLEDGFRRRIVDVVMHLVSDAVERDAAAAQVLHDFEQTFQTGLIGRAEVIDEQLRARRGELPGRLQRDVDVFGAQHRIEGAV